MAKILLNRKNASSLIKAIESRTPEDAVNEILASLRFAETHNQFSVDSLIERLEA